MLLNSYSVIYIFSQLLRAFKAFTRNKENSAKQRCPCYDNANTMMPRFFLMRKKKCRSRKKSVAFRSSSSKY